MTQIKKGHSFDVGAALSFMQDLATAGLGVADKAVTSPTGKVVDVICNVVGIDPAIAGGVKVIVGAVTKDPTAVADGAVQIGYELMQRAPAVTEYFEGTLNVGRDEKGRFGIDFDWKYDDGLMYADPRAFRIDYDRALDHFWSSLSKGVPPKRRLFEDSHKALPRKIDGDPKTKSDAPAADAPTSASPVDGQPGHPPAGAGPIASSTSASTSLDHEYLRSLQTIEHNWAALDETWLQYTGGIGGSVDQRELQRIAEKHPNEAIRRAAKFLVDHPEYQKRLFENNGNGYDATLQEVRSEIFEMQQRMAYGETSSPPQMQAATPTAGGPTMMPGEGNYTKGAVPNPGRSNTPPPQPTSSTPSQPAPVGQHPSPLWGILDDATLTIEERIMFLLQAVLNDADNEMMDLGKKVEDQRQARQDAIDAGADATKIGGYDTAIDNLTFRLQQIMERRKRMYELRSNMSNKFHEMAKTAIQNMGRA